MSASNFLCADSLPPLNWVLRFTAKRAILVLNIPASGLGSGCVGTEGGLVEFGSGRNDDGSRSNHCLGAAVRSTAQSKKYIHASPTNDDAYGTCTPRVRQRSTRKVGATFTDYFVSYTKLMVPQSVTRINR